jgi:hypothetical protein
VYRFVIVLIGLFMLAGQAMARDGAVATVKKNWHPGLPSPTYFTSMTIIPSYVFGVPWCFASATMIATVVSKRELKTSEAWQIFGSCIVPFLGGLVMQELFKGHPEWDVPQPATNVDRFGIGGQ